jgi:hypothetical protein
MQTLKIQYLQVKVPRGVLVLKVQLRLVKMTHHLWCNK